MNLEQARTILEHAHSAVVSMDEEGRITYWNGRAEETFGLSREQALGLDLAETLIPPHLRAHHREGLRRYLETGEGSLLNKRVELTALGRDGSEFPVELSIVPTVEDGGRSFHAFILDISERREGERERQRRLADLEQALRGSEERLGVILDALGEAVTIRGPDDRLIFANRAALERLNMDSREELRTSDPRALLGPYEVSREDGSEVRMEELPSVRVLRGETPEPLLLRSVRRSTGEESWALLKATAVRAPGGEIEAAVTIIEDVTVQRRATLRMEFLARAGEILASSLDYQQTLRNVAGLAVPWVADWCAVDLFGQDGRREPVAVAHIDPQRLEMARRLREYEPERIDPERGLGRVRATGQALLFNEITEEMLTAGARDPEHLRLLRDVGMRAALIVPLRAGGETIGALTLVSAESGRTFAPEDVEFVEQIAVRAALAVANARLYRHRVEVVRTLQSSLLPEALPIVPRWELAAFYRPAGEDSDVGGDFYDLWPVEGEWLMMIGDVTGKGVQAATVTSLVRHTAWASSDFDPRPAELLAHVDRALKRRPELPLCTALCVRLHEGGGTVACGGHPPLLRLGADGVSDVGRPGSLLGAFERVAWPEADFELAPGETLVGFTDGVTDAIGAGEERFGAARLRGLLAASHGLSPATIRERLLGELAAFQVGPQADDTAVVIMRFTGSQTAAGAASGTDAVSLQGAAR